MSFPAGLRLVAIGHVHGDAAKARAALRLAEVMGEGNSWTVAETVWVHVREAVHDEVSKPCHKDDHGMSLKSH